VAAAQAAGGPAAEAAGGSGGRAPADGGAAPSMRQAATRGRSTSDGLTGPRWDGRACLFFFIFLINRGVHKNTSENIPFTLTIALRRFQKCL